MQIQIDSISAEHIKLSDSSPQYQIFLLTSPVEILVDFATYQVDANSALFLSPYQHVRWLRVDERVLRVQFHGDFYCIEYHKNEVACNGLLFNNIYLQPHVVLSDETFREISTIIERMQKELAVSPVESVVKAYLQLILALSSKVKKGQIAQAALQPSLADEGKQFQALLEANFAEEKSIQFYAAAFNMSVNTFSRKIKTQLGKSPSDFVQERTILEAKKLLHLTFLPVKVVADRLGFEDEHYFSRYFKKYVGVSPTLFRKQVGISIVAKPELHP